MAEQRAMSVTMMMRRRERRSRLSTGTLEFLVRRSDTSHGGASRQSPSGPASPGSRRIGAAAWGGRVLGPLARPIPRLEPTPMRCAPGLRAALRGGARLSRRPVRQHERSQMQLLNWTRDNATAIAAQRFPLPLRSTVPATQFPGFQFNPDSWDRRVLTPARWPAGPLVSSPQQIVALFAAGSHLEGLAMVVSWGRMWRQPNSVYGTGPLEAIDAALRAGASSIQETISIAGAWAILTGQGKDQPGWSAVLTSKTLHFLCRALGFENNPPVAIDGLVIRNTVWPAWRRTVPPTVMPRDWKGDSLEAYLRYMTAILVWADRLGWTTPQIEATIFAEFRS